MSDADKKFKKLFGKIRKPADRTKFEALTGTSLERADAEAEVDAETDEEKKKRLKQLKYISSLSGE